MYTYNVIDCFFYDTRLVIPVLTYRIRILVFFDNRSVMFQLLSNLFYIIVLHYLFYIIVF